MRTVRRRVSVGLTLVLRLMATGALKASCCVRSACPTVSAHHTSLSAGNILLRPAPIDLREQLQRIVSAGTRIYLQRLLTTAWR